MNSFSTKASSGDLRKDKKPKTFSQRNSQSTKSIENRNRIASKRHISGDSSTKSFAKQKNEKNLKTSTKANNTRAKLSPTSDWRSKSSPKQKKEQNSKRREMPPNNNETQHKESKKTVKDINSDKNENESIRQKTPSSSKKSNNKQQEQPPLQQTPENIKLFQDNQKLFQARQEEERKMSEQMHKMKVLADQQLNNQEKASEREYIVKRNNVRLDRWIKLHFANLPQSRIEKLIRTKHLIIWREDQKVKGSIQSNFRLNIGDRVLFRAAFFGQDGPENEQQQQTKESESRGVLKNTNLVNKMRDMIIYKDDHIIAINKPNGLATQGGTNIKEHVDKYLDCYIFEEEKPGKNANTARAGKSSNTFPTSAIFEDHKSRPRLIHRLDKDTSGVLLLGRTLEATEKLQSMFKSHAKVKKLYLALVTGQPEPQSGRIRFIIEKAVIGGQEKMIVRDPKTVPPEERGQKKKLFPFFGQSNNNLSNHLTLSIASIYRPFEPKKKSQIKSKWQ